MLNHAMLDIETLGTTPGSVILSIGAVLFDPYGVTLTNPFYVNVDGNSQTQLTMTTDEDTVRWWSRPELDEARAKFSDPAPVAIEIALYRLQNWFTGNKAKFVWGHGCGFDVVLVEEAYRRIGKKAPWNFRAARDTRTVFSMLPNDWSRPPEGSLHVPHFALHDAMYQAECVQVAYKTLGLKDPDK